jgi:AraC family transcriptional regulator
MNEHDWTVEAEACSSGVRVQIVCCDWPRPTEYFETNPWHAVNFSLTPIPEGIEGFLKVGATIGQRSDVGRLAFVPAHSQIGCRGSGGRRQRAVRAFLDPEKLAYKLPAAHEFAPASLRACLNLNAPEIDRIMIRLSKEASEPGFGCSVLLEALGAVITVELERLLLSRGSRSSVPARSVLAQPDFKRIVDYIDSRSSATITITDVAQACNISSRTLTRKFKHTTGETLHEYAHRCATKRARALLRDMTRSIKEVSYDLGFLNPSAFSIAFRRATGLSPTEYRRSVA